VLVPLFVELIVIGTHLPYNSIVQLQEGRFEMISVGISEFRARMNAILQKVQNGEVVTLTSRGVEIAKLVPPDFTQAAARQELEQLRQTAVVGDVLSPVVEEDHWHAAQ
jgi:prevent-host-death family protein